MLKAINSIGIILGRVRLSGVRRKLSGRCTRPSKHSSNFDSLRIIVEFDGSYWHAQPAIRARDELNADLATSDGWRVLRIQELPLSRSDPTTSASSSE